jgi:7-cyano-7-deazaguanine synthase in queuosine biosynthesis
VKKRVVVGMSGGVDSSVAALLLRDAGHEVRGVTMSIYSGKISAVPVPDSCYGPGEQKDIEEAARTCAGLGIPYTVVDLRNTKPQSGLFSSAPSASAPSAIPSSMPSVFFIGMVFPPIGKRSASCSGASAPIACRPWSALFIPFPRGSRRVSEDREFP